MSGFPPDKLQVLALLEGILITYTPKFVLPLHDGIISFTYRLVMELVRDCLTKYQQGRISSEYLEHLQQNIRTLVQQAEEKSNNNGELYFFKQLAQNVLYVLEHPARSLERLETSIGDSEEGQSLNIADPEPNHPGLIPDLTEGITVPANTDGGICETSEIIHESVSAVIGSLNPRRKACKSDYKPIKLISSGGFGAVHLVRNKDTNQICAMKKMDKQNLKKPRNLELAFLERDISTFTDCPFVVSMFCSFPTKLHLCMVMEYAPGGDCGSLLKSRGPLPVSLARLYIAETVQAVEYLHSYGVVHRDLKPENLLITSTGHIKVTDFGVSKLGLMRPPSDIYKAPTKEIIREFLDKETFGTPTYMAPEVIQKTGYGRPVDWWSVGIILYKFIFGRTPFNGASRRDLCRSILMDNIPWTNYHYCAPRHAREIITGLLKKNPAFRLGTGGAKQIKSHPFLRDLDFDNLLSQKSLFVPVLKSDEDTHYFNTRRNIKHINSVEEDTCEDNDSLSQRFSKPYTINTEMKTNEELMSPPACTPQNSEKHSDPEMKTNEELMSPAACTPQNSEKHSDMPKESAPSKIDGDDQLLMAKNNASSAPSLSETPVQKGRKSALKLRKQQKAEKVQEGESRRGSIFRRMISSCRRALSRAARSIRGSCLCACCHR